MDDNGDSPLTISPEKAFYIIVKAREFDEKVEQSDPDSGSNPSDDGSVQILEDSPDDPTYQELMAALEGLNQDELFDLVALMWVGRGDFTTKEWTVARQQVRDVRDQNFPQYLSGTPLLGDYLEEALAQLGYDLEEYGINRL